MRDAVKHLTTHRTGRNRMSWLKMSVVPRLRLCSISTPLIIKSVTRITRELISQAY